MNQKGGIFIGLLILILGFGFAGIYILFIEPIMVAFATNLNLPTTSVTIISGGVLVILLITLYFAFTQNTNTPWWIGTGRR